MVLRYAGNLSKAITCAVAIVLTSLLSVILFDFGLH
jgi:hypothetical protein